jgi:hypothetical protein
MLKVVGRTEIEFLLLVSKVGHPNVDQLATAEQYDKSNSD